jgi:hypothetical protein
MTPQEKADELIRKYYRNSNLIGEDLTWTQAKECALIAIDEIIKECYMWNGNDNVIWETNRFNYWNEVKQEIKNYD